jgi:hypothetical protein
MVGEERWIGEIRRSQSLGVSGQFLDLPVTLTKRTNCCDGVCVGELRPSSVLCCVVGEWLTSCGVLWCGVVLKKMKS